MKILWKISVFSFPFFSKHKTLSYFFIINFSHWYEHSRSFIIRFHHVSPCVKYVFIQKIYDIFTVLSWLLTMNSKKPAEWKAGSLRFHRTFTEAHRKKMAKRNFGNNRKELYNIKEYHNFFYPSFRVEWAENVFQNDTIKKNMMGRDRQRECGVLGEKNNL